MKWIAIVGILSLMVPATTWLRANQSQLPRVMMVLGLLQFLNGLIHVGVAPISWAGWPGYVKGTEVTIIDAIAVVVIAASPARKRIAHLRWPVGLVVLAALLSATQSNVPVASLFYAWQLVRVAVLITAVAISCHDPRTPRAILLGLAIGVAVQALMSTGERFAGAIQSAGTFGHQNQLGMMTHFVTFPTLAMLLSSRQGRWPWLGLIASMAVVILTASRATIGLAAIGCVLLLALSIARRSTPRKTSIAIAGIALLTIAAPLAMITLNDRFERTDQSGGYDERAAFERAAMSMAKDHPFGVGANNYVVVANTQGYSARAGVATVSGSLSAQVHNAYLLSAAEMGFGGMAVFAVMMMWPILVALRCSWRFRKDARGELLLGLAAALIVVAVHSLFEWIFVSYQVEYMYAITVGLIAGVSHQMGFWTKRSRARKVVPRTTTEDIHVTA